MLTSAMDQERRCLESTRWPAQRSVGHHVELRVSEQDTISVGANDRHENDGREAIGSTCMIGCRC